MQGFNKKPCLIELAASAASGVLGDLLKHFD